MGDHSIYTTDWGLIITKVTLLQSPKDDPGKALIIIQLWVWRCTEDGYRLSPLGGFVSATQTQGVCFNKFNTATVHSMFIIFRDGKTSVRRGHTYRLGYVLFRPDGHYLTETLS